MDAGFFRGTSAEQDNRFSNKHKKLLVTEILGFEDDVVIEFVFNQLEEKNPDGKMMQINLTGFLNGKNAREFMKDLWPLLLSAQENIAGIPSAFLEQKKEEIKQRQVMPSDLRLVLWSRVTYVLIMLSRYFTMPSAPATMNVTCAPTLGFP
uniref:PWI domain-containing protein n=1 Tax=Sinocyclocheilus anshuiensis TaxID=1608454 RepID=A0A671Q5Q8_9TELE